ncbi:hypothetical protein U9M48_002089 [Paspalum notatum var. saurae]|uniref:CCHC-type domain-containing protein n=1 Tax=Paspalum notatum var. saurae TaxID=547442 RepID=A0AAQ3SH73_PASNO
MSESSKGKGVATERAVAGVVEVPLLTRGNYHEWSLVMKVSLEALGLWHVVETDKVERRDDRMALAAILSGVPSELKAVLAIKNTAKEAWAAVKTMRVGKDRVKVVNKQRLMKEFENMVFQDGKRIDDFAVRINGIIGGLHELGEEIKDGRVMCKVLCVVPKKWKQVAVSIEMLLDLDKMTIEELIGRLRVAEQADDEDAAVEAEVGCLYLTEEQWQARHRHRVREQRRADDARRGSGGGDGRCSGCSGNQGNGGCGDDNDGNDGDDEASSMCSRRSPRCFECGRHGHFARDCRDCKEKNEVALLASADKELALL